MNTIVALQSMGLSEKEAKVYLALLELGQSSIQEIGNKAGVNRTTTYVIIETLLKKGLCSLLNKDKKVFYLAADPETLLNFFENDLRRIEEKKQQLIKVLPSLKQINNADPNRPAVRYFESDDVLNYADLLFEDYERIKKTNEPVRTIFPEGRIEEVFSPSELATSRNSRKNRAIPVRSLVSADDTKVIQSTADGLRIKMDPEKEQLTADIAIYGNNVRILDLNGKISVTLLRDPDIAQAMKVLFDLAWEGAKAKYGIAPKAEEEKDKNK
ncbi:MAG: helix-turn-helix domain-containing protein [bacterium]